MGGRWRALRRVRPVKPAPPGQVRRPEPREVEPDKPPREPVLAWHGTELSTPAGEALDTLAAAAFGGERGQARLEPLLDRFAGEVGVLTPDDEGFELLSVYRMDWALCDAAAEPEAVAGDSWAHRARHRRIPGFGQDLDEAPLLEAAVASVCGLFEVYPGEPTWVRDRVNGLVLRVLDRVGPLEPDEYTEAGEPVALWEMRLVPDPSGGFLLARPPIDYPIELIDDLDQQFGRRFEVKAWPSMQDLRRARLRYLRAGKRTPIGRMLQWS